MFSSSVLWRHEERERERESAPTNNHAQCRQQNIASSSAAGHHNQGQNQRERMGLGGGGGLVPSKKGVVVPMMTMMMMMMMMKGSSSEIRPARPVGTEFSRMSSAAPPSSERRYVPTTSGLPRPRTTAVGSARESPFPASPNHERMTAGARYHALSQTTWVRALSFWGWRVRGEGVEGWRVRWRRVKDQVHDQRACKSRG